MAEKLDAILDECIDLMNRGGSIEECLARYPEYSEEVEPMLRTMLSVGDALAVVPSTAGRAAARQRLDAALDSLKGKLQERRRGFTLPFGRPKAWIMVTAVVLLAIIAGASYWALRPGEEPGLIAEPLPPAEEGEEANFRLLISDQPNDIGDFQSLEVTLSSVRVHSAGTGDWIALTPPTEPVDLVQLQGPNAKEVWSGDLDPGQYTIVFLDASAVDGVLLSGDTADVKLPSDKLRLNKPFEVTSGTQITFVFDISVVSAGQSGHYVLKPVIGESGTGQPFNLVGQGDLTLQLQGQATPGDTATVLVELQGAPVENATVTVNGVDVGTTDTSGLVSFTVPDVDELKIVAVSNGHQGELEIDLSP